MSRLMGRAGKALAVRAMRFAGEGEMVLVFCGKGNNGGDGFAAAALLHEAGRDVRVVMAEPASKIRAGPSRSYLNEVPKDKVGLFDGWQRAWDAKVVLDCLLGSGVQGGLRPPYRRIVQAINRRRKEVRIIACDVPSGFPGPGIQPHETVTFHDKKEGMTKARCGTVHVADIGIPRAADDIGIGDLDVAFRRPSAGSHKGENGRVLIVGGSIPLVGAPYYASLGAYRAGADLVFCATAGEAAPVIRGYGPETIVHAIGKGAHLVDEAGLASLVRKVDAVVLGPGLGTHPDALAAARRVLAAAAASRIAVVVDADGLEALGPALLRRHGGHMVLTPHAREFKDLAGRSASEANVVAYARRHGVTLLRKGPVDVVSDGTRTRRCHRGHATMTVGGTGDVLAGAVAALLAKGAPPFEAACGAAYLVGVAGEIAGSLRSFGASALDVAEAIPAVLARLR